MEIFWNLTVNPKTSFSFLSRLAGKATPSCLMACYMRVSGMNRSNLQEAAQDRAAFFSALMLFWAYSRPQVEVSGKWKIITFCIKAIITFLRENHFPFCMELRLDYLWRSQCHIFWKCMVTVRKSPAKDIQLWSGGELRDLSVSGGVGNQWWGQQSGPQRSIFIMFLLELWRKRGENPLFPSVFWSFCLTKGKALT